MDNGDTRILNFLGTNPNITAILAFVDEEAHRRVDELRAAAEAGNHAK